MKPQPFLRVSVAVSLVCLWGSIPTASAQDPPVDALLLGHWDEYEGFFSDVWTDGTYAYLGNWAGGDGLAARMFIVDISDPTNPTLASTFFFPSPNQFASPQDIKVVDGIAYVALEGDGNDGVAIVDVRNPLNPALLATTRLPAYDDTHNVYFADGFLYMCDSQTERVGILDLRNFDPDNPPPSPITTPKWIMDPVGGSFVHDVTVLNNRLYCAGWNDGLFVYDVSNVANEIPVFLGSVDGSSTHSMYATDDGQYVVTGEERENGGIKVYRITEDGDGMLSFTLTDSLVLSEDAYTVHNQNIVGYRLYNSWYQAGVQIFDINPTTGELEFRSSFDTSIFNNNGTYAGCWGIYGFLGDDRILASDIEEGLFIIAGKQDDCTPGEDCNNNGVSDFCDMIEGDSADCNHTIVPDECELADGSSDDCQSNGVPDECEPDCNANSVADECDLSSGTSLDCQPNGIPDECEADCNANLIPDDCDLSEGTSIDCQPNGVPDECDLAAGPTIDILRSQAPNHSDGTPADADDSTLYNPTSVAENFVLEYAKTITSVTIYGAYIIGNSPPAVEVWTVRILADDDGSPGAVISNQTNVPFTREQTGVELFGFWDEYEVTLTLATPVDLDTGTYYVEIYDNTDNDNDTFLWETADMGDLPGFWVSSQIPGSNWTEVAFGDLSLTLAGGVIGADCNLNGDPDECDVAEGNSNDSDGDGVPDECSACDGDANGDGAVDPLDSGFVLARLGCPVDTGDPNCNISDQNHDGLVDPLDVGYVLSRFGQCP